MKISVAMTTYNGEKYVFEQMDSIFNQLLPVNEVIISDDGSSDDTVDIVTRFIEDRRLDHWQLRINPVNQGFAHNFLSTVLLTTGDVVFLADQDDIWLPSRTQEMCRLMEQDPDIMALSSMAAYIDAEGNPYGRLESKAAGERDNRRMKANTIDDYLGASYIPGCTTCINGKVRESLRLEHLIPLNRSIGHDWYLGIIAAILGKNVLFNRILLKRRIHEANASGGQMRKRTILSSSNEKRISNLKEVKSAHEYIVRQSAIGIRLSSLDKEKMLKTVALFDRRIRFSEHKNLLEWLMLGMKLGRYKWIARSVKGAVRLWLTDLLYAYNINWKVAQTS